MTITKTATAVVLLAAGFTPLSRADTVLLDQINEVTALNGSTTTVTLGAIRDFAQTITVGKAGILSGIGLGVLRDPNEQATLTVDIVSVIGGVPDFSAGGVLAHREILASEIPFPPLPPPGGPRFTIDVNVADAEISVTPGDVLAIVLRSSATTLSSYRWWVNTSPNPPAYAGGEMYFRSLPDGTVVPFSGKDAHFRTFVAVAEPSSWLLAVGLMAVATLCRRNGGRKFGLRSR